MKFARKRGLAPSSWPLTPPRSAPGEVPVPFFPGAGPIVSRNFRHIVRLDKMRTYNEVNLQAGVGLLSIVSSQEVRFDEE